MTREHVTLQFLKERQPQGFSFPNVLYHFEIGSRYFLIVSRVPGQLLEEAWPNLNETFRQYYISKVADVCDRLATWKGDIVSGVDGHQLLERYLVKGNSNAVDALSPQQLLRNCTEMSMDVSTLVFYHCDLGPTNLLIDTSTGSLGIIDWELAGYAQQEWILITETRILKRTGAAESPSIWKVWAIAMLWMHGGSFRTASRHYYSHIRLPPSCTRLDHFLHLSCFRPRHLLVSGSTPAAGLRGRSRRIGARHIPRRRRPPMLGG